MTENHSTICVTGSVLVVVRERHSKTLEPLSCGHMRRHACDSHGHLSGHCISIGRKRTQTLVGCGIPGTLAILHRSRNTYGARGCSLHGRVA